jgi:hypothetical protein
MKTSKVKSITKVSEYNGQNGLTYYHHLIMDNGDKINIGKKAKLNGGEELTYELTGGADDQFEYKKAKSVQPQRPAFTGGGKYEAKDTGVITMLSCISSACTAVAQSSKGGDKAFILDMAESFFKAAMSKSTKTETESKPVNIIGKESKLPNDVYDNTDLPF